MRRAPQVSSFIELCIFLSCFIIRSSSFTATSHRTARSGTRMTASAPNDELASTASQDSLRDELLDQILEVAIEASKKAGDIILGNAGGAEITERKANSRDLLTLIDPLCEKVRVVLHHFCFNVTQSKHLSKTIRFFNIR